MCSTSCENSNYGRGLLCQWAAPSESLSKYAKEQPGYVAHSLPPPPANMWNAQSVPKAIDASLPPSELIADVVQRPSHAHMFHFYTLLCKTVSLPQKLPNGWIAADRLATSG